MATFFKTFFICILLTLSFLVYKFVATESYDLNLSPSGDSHVFSLNKEDNNNKNNIEENTQTQETKKQEEDKKEDVVKYSATCYFYSPMGKLTPVKREIKAEANLENTIVMLLKGPTVGEAKKGFYSEIPSGVDLISVKRNSKSITVNLTSAFGEGGGSESIENRVKQLAKTVKEKEPNKLVYLYIDNKEVEYLGGEGVYIKQPLE